MIKKLLNFIYKIFSKKNEKDIIEKYLAQSINTYDLEYRIRELDKSGKYSKFFM